MDGDISAILGKIVDNPEFASLVSEINGTNDAEAIQREMREKLPEVMKTVAPLLGGIGNSAEKSGEKDKNRESVPKEESVSPAMLKPSKYDKKRAAGLMKALKPYLSPSRAEIIDKCVSLLELGDIVSLFGDGKMLETLAKMK